MRLKVVSVELCIPVQQTRVQCFKSLRIQTFLSVPIFPTKALLIFLFLWQVHSRGKALAKDVDFEKIARRTPGFTGADLQNLMNEAAILAARRDLKEISKDEISDALERIIAGPEKKNAVVSEDKKKLVAYHGI